MKCPKEDAIGAVIAQLKKIQRKNGYATDLQTVYRIDLNEDQIIDAKLPALLVLDDPEGETWEPFDQGYRARLPIRIQGMLSVGTTDVTDPERVTKLNWFIRDVVTALVQDSTFGRAMKDSVLHRVESAVDSDRGFGYFDLHTHLTYYFTYASLVA